MVDGKDASSALLGGEVGHLGTTVEEGGQAVEAEADVAPGLFEGRSSGLADRHAEAMEGGGSVSLIKGGTGLTSLLR